MKAIPPVAITTQVLKNMVDPRRPWRRLNWIRIVDFYHAAQYVQQLGEAIFGAGTAASNWAHEMRLKWLHCNGQFGKRVSSNEVRSRP